MKNKYMPFGNGINLSSMVRNDSALIGLNSEEAYNKKMWQFKKELFGFIGSRYNSNSVINSFDYFDKVLKSIDLSKSSTDSRLFLESIVNQGAEFHDKSFRITKCYLHVQKILDSTKDLYKIGFSKPKNPLFF